MARQLTSHIVAGLNENLLVVCYDKPGQEEWRGGACHEYQIRHQMRHSDEPSDIELCHIKFQNGPIKEFGVNGISHEALLAIVEDRLLSFQAGPYACKENEQALLKLQEAMLWLQKRTRDRVTRDVEGTSQV